MVSAVYQEVDLHTCVLLSNSLTEVACIDIKHAVLVNIDRASASSKLSILETL